MTAARYTIQWYTAEGVSLGTITQWQRLSYALVTNDIGSLVLTIVGNVTIPATVIPDGQIEIWRRLPDGNMMVPGPYRWIVQSVETALTSDGLRETTITAMAPLWLLREPGRFVNAVAGSAEAAKTGAADNLMKAIVREQAGSSASATRQIPGLTVAADVGIGASISKAFAWREVLKVLQELAQTSTDSGAYLAFDITSDGVGGWLFDTYSGQRGEDRRSTGTDPTIFGSAFGNLGETRLRIDYADEVTAATAGGQGDGADRLIATATDSNRIAVSPYRYRETFRDATRYNTTTGLSNEAQSILRAGRPRLTLEGQILQTETCVYGRDWHWGDYVTLQEFGVILDARIDAVTVDVDGAREDVRAVLRAETYL